MPINPSDRCRQCAAVLAQAAQDREERPFVKLAQAHPNCACEVCSLSEYSPGPIGNAEMLARFVFSPHQVNEDGTVKSNAFDMVFNKGLSINRLSYTTSADLHVSGRDWVENKRQIDKTEGRNVERAYLGFVTALASEVRGVTIEDRRAICAYDTALANNIAHGDLAVSMQLTSLQKGVLRRQLYGKFTVTLTKP